MRLLYYSTSYHAKHGGSIQSIAFFRELEVSHKYLFPKSAEGVELKKTKRGKLRRLLRKIPILQVLFFYRRNTFYWKGLKNEILEKHPDVVLLQIDSNFLQITKLKKEFPKLIIATQINGSPFDEAFKNIAFKSYFEKEQRKNYQKTDANIFISNFSRNSVMGKYLKSERDFVIHNGTNFEKFFPILKTKALRQKWGYAEGAFILGYVGTLDVHKKMELLIEVFTKLYSDFSNLRLVIIGDGPAREKIEKRIKKLNMQHFIILKGWLAHEDINENLNCFDIAVHHYANKYMNPLKVFEYLSAGLPVIAPDISSLRQSFKENEEIMFTDPESGDLAEKLREMITNDELRARLGNNQELVKKIQSNYSWKRYAERISEILELKLKQSKN